MKRQRRGGRMRAAGARRRMKQVVEERVVEEVEEVEEEEEDEEEQEQEEEEEEEEEEQEQESRAGRARGKRKAAVLSESSSDDEEEEGMGMGKACRVAAGKREVVGRQQLRKTQQKREKAEKTQARRVAQVEDSSEDDQDMLCAASKKSRDAKENVKDASYARSAAKERQRRPVQTQPVRRGEQREVKDYSEEDKEPHAHDKGSGSDDEDEGEDAAVTRKQRKHVAAGRHGQAATRTHAQRKQRSRPRQVALVEDSSEDEDADEAEEEEEEEAAAPLGSVSLMTSRGNSPAEQQSNRLQNNEQGDEIVGVLLQSVHPLFWAGYLGEPLPPSTEVRDDDDTLLFRVDIKRVGATPHCNRAWAVGLCARGPTHSGANGKACRTDSKAWKGLCGDTLCLDWPTKITESPSVQESVSSDADVSAAASAAATTAVTGQRPLRFVTAFRSDGARLRATSDEGSPHWEVHPGDGDEDNTVDEDSDTAVDDDEEDFRNETVTSSCRQPTREGHPADLPGGSLDTVIRVFLGGRNGQRAGGDDCEIHTHVHTSWATQDGAKRRQTTDRMTYRVDHATFFTLLHAGRVRPMVCLRGDLMGWLRTGPLPTSSASSSESHSTSWPATELALVAPARVTDKPHAVDSISSANTFGVDAPFDFIRLRYSDLHPSPKHVIRDVLLHDNTLDAAKALVQTLCCTPKPTAATAATSVQVFENTRDWDSLREAFTIFLARSFQLEGASVAVDVMKTVVAAMDAHRDAPWTRWSNALSVARKGKVKHKRGTAESRETSGKDSSKRRQMPEMRPSETENADPDEREEEAECAANPWTDRIPFSDEQKARMAAALSATLAKTAVVREDRKKYFQGVAHRLFGQAGIARTPSALHTAEQAVEAGVGRAEEDNDTGDRDENSADVGAEEQAEHSERAEDEDEIEDDGDSQSV